MKLFSILLLFALNQGQQAEMAVRWDDVTAITAGESISVEVNIELPPEIIQAQVRLLPLQLENLRMVDSSQSAVAPFAGDGRSHRYQFALEAIEPGDAIVGEFQAELVLPGEDAEPVLLTHQGFSLKIVKPPKITDIWPWILLVAVILIAGVLLVLMRRRAQPDRREFLSPEDKRKQRMLKDIDELRLMGEWKKVVDLSYGALLIELSGMRETQESVRLSSDRIRELAEHWPDFPAAYRLGEEVRYGGYLPSKREAVFMAELLNDVLSDESLHGDDAKKEG
jgi:hypothetical protein